MCSCLLQNRPEYVALIIRNKDAGLFNCIKLVTYQLLVAIFSLIFNTCHLRIVVIIVINAFYRTSDRFITISYIRKQFVILDAK